MRNHTSLLSVCARRIVLTMLTLLMLSMPGLAYAQQEPNAISVPNLNWYTMYGNSDTDRADAMTSDSSGNIYVVGSTKYGWQYAGMEPLHPFGPRQNGFEYSMVIAKFNSSGQLLWHTYYGNSKGATSGSSILIDASGNLYIVGKSDGEWDGLTAKRPFHGSVLSENGYPYDDIFVLKLNSAGAYQWHTFYGSDYLESGLKAVLESGGNIFIAGQTQQSWAGLTPKRPFSGTSAFFALSVDPAGNYRWHTFYGMQTERLAMMDMQIDPAGDVYLTGYSDGDFIGIQPLRPRDTSDSDILVMKMSKEGVLQWHTFYGGWQDDSGGGIVFHGGNLYVTGQSTRSWDGLNPLHPISGNGIANLFVLKLNSAGAYQWHTFYGPAGGSDLAIDSFGRIIVAGFGSDFPGMTPISPHIRDWDSLLMILDAQGNYVSHAYYGTEDAGQQEMFEFASEILLVGNKLYMLGTSGYSWPAFSFPPLQASYHEWDTYLASISIVNKPASATTTHLEVTSNPSEIGHTITLTTDVTSVGGVPFGGKVTFKDGATTLGVADLINGQAKLNTTPLSLGTHSITAQYSGTPAFLPSQTPGAIPLEIVKASTHVSLLRYYTSSPYGKEAIFEVSVNSVNQNIYQPGGWVVLKEGTRVISSAMLTYGQAQIRISDLPVGNLLITAESIGGDVFAPSKSGVLPYQVTKADTTSTLAALPSDILSYGNDLKLQATVTHQGDPSVMPDGTVTFWVDGQGNGSAMLVNGTAAVSTHTLLPGTHQVEAIYTGSGKFNPALPVPRVITITRGVPRITLTPEGGSAINSGETKRITISVQGAYSDLIQPTGTVTLYQGETEITTLTLVSGAATSEPLTLPDGAHSFTATYTGDAYYLSETSRPAVVIVAGIPTYLPVMVR